MCTLCIQIKDKFNEINVMATTQYHVFIWSSVLALIGCVAVTSSSNNQDNNQEVVFGLIIDGENNGRAAAMVEKAVDDVNRRSDLLTNFRLKSLPLSVDPTVRPEDT